MIKVLWLYLSLILFFLSCTKNTSTTSDNPSVQAGYPAVSTVGYSNVAGTTASVSSNVTSDGGNNVISKGVCWSASTGATINLSTKTIDGSGTGSYTSSLIGLLPNTTYYVRSYATNSKGTSYGNELTFTTINISTTLSSQMIGTWKVIYTGTRPGHNGKIADTSYYDGQMGQGNWDTTIYASNTHFYIHEIVNFKEAGTPYSQDRGTYTVNDAAQTRTDYNNDGHGTVTYNIDMSADGNSFLATWEHYQGDPNVTAFFKFQRIQ